ncbi:MAG: hypothetical protein MIO92_10570 [Methanosarcinaceae archaeon]|jgi:hypothetical protein|nr:hypothetical protein [Methanosarcinaceae archaeon]
MKKIRIRTTKGRSIKYLKIHDRLNTITWTPTESKALLFEDIDKALEFIRENKKEKTWFADILTWDKYGMPNISNAWA